MDVIVGDLFIQIHLLFINMKAQSIVIHFIENINMPVKQSIILKIMSFNVENKE
jgi:hypothetical protein